MCIISKEMIAFCAQVEGARGDIIEVSPIALQSRCKRVPKEPIPTYSHSWPQRQSVRLKLETNWGRKNGETAIGGRHAMRREILRPGVEYVATGMSLTAVAEHVHSGGAILRRPNILLLMMADM